MKERLTLEELKIVAARAKTYPKGFGMQWGTGPLVNEIEEDLEDHSVAIQHQYG